ncbi:ankyrin repeat and SOCS box protein 12-like [Chiloscyllium plagiosum]|uniref:ankyrin repeat and SOCS box protein 12-like n=1 Tax=Chiloscyllium plagiosum TaxID=36176 RepID=UPI001CB7EB49|nr:ankyrin repeat and SOCS box protein 12-like [Chiloscyllium plagiosum]
MLKVDQIMSPMKMSLVDVSKIFSMLQPRNQDDNVEVNQINQAISRNDATLLSELLSQERYAQFINNRSGWGVPGTPLRLAASKGHVSCLEILLRYGAEVDSLDVKAQTPLFTAVSGRHLHCVRALLRAGANPNGSIYNNCSPVLTAAREGDMDILQALLEYGAEVNVRSKVPEWASNACACSGPLYLASVYRHYECFRLLLLYGADPDFNCTEQRLLAKIKQPKTVLEMCLRYGCGPQYIQLLIDFGANLYLPGHSPVKNTQQNKAAELLARATAQPRSLMSLTRMAIRKSLKLLSGLQSIDQLDIPLILRKYLKHQT